MTNPISKFIFGRKAGLALLLLALGFGAFLRFQYPPANDAASNALPIISKARGAALPPNPLLPSFIEVQSSDGNIFMAGATELTVDQWQACVNADVCADLSGSELGDHPMVGMSWLDVTVYIDWVSERTGIPLRVPTLDEWLALAAESAPEPPKPLFEDPRLAWAANYDLNVTPQSKATETMKSFGANQLGIYDLSGNVWEWVDGCYYPQPGLSIEEFGCVSGRIAMGERKVGLSERLRDPGNGGCSGGQPPANVGVRLVYSPSTI